MTDLILIRGLPGSGKTTLTDNLNATAVAADDFFTSAFGVYEFDPALLGTAHAYCQHRTLTLLNEGSNVVVHNTFSCRWEMQPYIEMAQTTGARLVVVDIYDGGCSVAELFERTTHGVPMDAIANMRLRWEHDWKNGNPTPPWERE